MCLSSLEALVATMRGKGFGSATTLAVPSPWFPGNPQLPSPCLRRCDSRVQSGTSVRTARSHMRVGNTGNHAFSLKPRLQEVLTATLDLEDVRSYRAEISSRNLAVSCGDARGRSTAPWDSFFTFFLLTVLLSCGSRATPWRGEFATLAGLCSHQHKKNLELLASLCIPSRPAQPPACFRSLDLPLLGVARRRSHVWLQSLSRTFTRSLS